MKNVLATMAAAALLALSSCAGATEAPSVSENASGPASTSADPADAVYAVYLLVIHHRKMRAKRQIKFKGRPGEGRFLKLI